MAAMPATWGGHGGTPASAHKSSQANLHCHPPRCSVCHQDDHHRSGPKHIPPGAATSPVAPMLEYMAPA